MTYQKGIPRILKDNLVTLLESIEIGGVTGNKFKEVSETPKFDFPGYPSCLVAPSGNEAEYLTQNENIRQYVFKIWVLQEFQQTSLADAFNIAYDAVDAICDALDKQMAPGDTPMTMATGVNVGQNMLSSIVAAPSRFISDEQNQMIGAEITVTCKVTIDLSVL